MSPLRRDQAQAPKVQAPSQSAQRAMPPVHLHECIEAMRCALWGRGVLWLGLLKWIPCRRAHYSLPERLGSGDGERKTLLTRQIAFETLPASVLLALGCCDGNCALLESTVFGQRQLKLH